MKQIATLLMSLFLLVVLALGVNAETVLDITGQVRVRGEASRKSFDNLSTHFQHTHSMRTRVNVKGTVDDNATAFVQFQDTRTFGGVNQFDDLQSSGLNDSKNVDLHQAYITYNLWTKENWSIGVLAGRFEFNWGNQRLLGAVGWHNVGRSWEGGLLWYNAEKFKITLASLKALELNSQFYNRDFDAYALALSLKEYNLDVLGLYEIDADTNDYFTDVKALKRTTLAAFYKRKVEQIDMEFNVALQTGKMGVMIPSGNPADTLEEMDISAMMFAGEVGYTFEGDKKARVAFGIDYASGDNGDDSTKHKTFNNLYWTGHKFNGYMDYFLGGGPNGLMDIMLRGQFELLPGWTVKGDIHLFSAAQDYAYDTGDTTATGAPIFALSSDVGTEIDITVKTNRVKGVALQWGLSFFTAKDAYANKREGLYPGETQSGVWGYCQAVVNF